MKSEKARQELDYSSWKVEVDLEGEGFDLPYYAVRVDVAQHAVETAERDAILAWRPPSGVNRKAKQTARRRNPSKCSRATPA